VLDSLPKGEPIPKYTVNKTEFIAENNKGEVNEIKSADDVSNCIDISDYIKLYNRALDFKVVKNGEEYSVNVSMVYHYYVDDFPYYLAVNQSGVNDQLIGSLQTTGETGTETDQTPDTYYKVYNAQIYLSDSSIDEEKYFTYSVSLEKDTIFTGKDLERLYIYYYPQYDLDDGMDQITVAFDKADDIKNFSCYIIKQNNTSFSDTYVALKEEKYKPQVICNNWKSTFKLYHNFDTNVSNSKSGSKTAGAVITNISQDNVGSITASFDNDEYLSYDITVEIYDSNSKLVSTLNSTKNEPINTAKQDVEGVSSDDMSNFDTQN
jgi:hypothetical protein